MAHTGIEAAIVFHPSAATGGAIKETHVGEKLHPLQLSPGETCIFLSFIAGDEEQLALQILLERIGETGFPSIRPLDQILDHKARHALLVSLLRLLYVREGGATESSGMGEAAIQSEIVSILHKAGLWKLIAA